MEDAIKNIASLRKGEHMLIKLLAAKYSDCNVVQALSAIHSETCATMSSALTTYGPNMSISAATTEASTAPKD